MVIARFLRTVFLLLASGILLAQPASLRLDAIELPARTPVATVDCIFEDSRGFVWIGAYTGLYRFDGYEMLHFRHDPGDSTSIGDNKIKAIAETPEGDLWVGTQVGLNHFDPETRRFKQYADTLASGIGKVEINDLWLDERGVLWVAAMDGLYRFDADADRFMRVAGKGAAAGLFTPAETGLYFIFGHELWLRQPGKSIRTTGLSFHPSAVLDMQYNPPNAAFPGGLLLVATKDRFLVVDLATLRVQEEPALRGVTTYALFRNGLYWMLSTDKGICRLDPVTLQAELPVPVHANGTALATEAFVFNEYLTLSDGTTWLFTTTRKMYRYDPLKSRFHHAPIDLMEPLKAASAFCELFEYEPGVLLLPRENGPVLFDLRTGKRTPFPFTPTYNETGWKGGVICFLEEDDGKLWIGTRGGLFLFDRRAGRFLPLEQEFPGIKQMRDNTPRDIHRDKRGMLWVATWNNGIFQIDTKGKTIRHYLHSPTDRVAYSYAGRSILEARDGTLWFGTRGGLFHYFPARDSFAAYRHDPSDPRSMSENTAFCIYEDDAGTIWTGSYGGGLNRLDVKAGTFTHYTTDDGLLNNNVFSLLPDSRKNLWMLTFNGITRFDPVQNNFRTFTQDQGLLNDNFDGFLYGRSRYDSSFFFGGTKGVDYFHPDSVITAKAPPKLYFTGFRLFNESVPVGADASDPDRFTLPQDISYTREITLRYDQNVISFDFAALEYTSPATIRYAYQLVGFDTAWQYIGEKRSVTFTNLDPGAYTLNVKSSNSDGIWDAAESNVRSLRIQVTPPWWQTWWFRISALLGFAGLLTGFYQYRVGQIREREAIRADLNQRIAQVKMEALRSQMNPHFVFNCLTSLKLFVERNETEKASDHISKFATLLRRVLDDARTETETVPLERELDTLKRYVELEMIRFKDTFDFRMEIDPELDLQLIEVPPLILQPYVENAILHGLQNRRSGGKGTLLLKAGLCDDALELVIEDNGVGRAAAAAIKAGNPGAGPSHGLNVTAERLDYFSRKFNTWNSVETTDLYDAAGAPAGTRVTLRFQID